jgi:sugar phosphate isomerase/epimerase
MRLALHTWTLDTTPLADTLRIAHQTGWEAIELRRLDFVRAQQAGSTSADIIRLVRDSSLPVSALGVEFGWMFAMGSERERLLRVFRDSCEAAHALGSRLVMSPCDRGRGPLADAARSVQEVGDIAAGYSLRVALEFGSQSEQFNTLASVRELLALADQPAVGLLLDTYHLERSGCHGACFADLAPAEIVYVQYSDVPRSGLVAGQAMDRLPPGRGVVAFDQVFALLHEKGYNSDVSYEAPNPSAWARDATEVAREAAEASRQVLRL